MNITRFSISRPVGISMIVAFFVVLGCYSYYRIGVELLPALNTPYVTVTVKYPGASAESVEQEIVKPVEDAVSGVSDVKKITSTASYERARIMLELNFDANADTAAIDATKKVEAIKNKLPDEAESPVVIKRDINAKPIVELAVMSQHSLADTYTMSDDVFQEVLQQAGGVSEIELHGGRDKEVAIEVDRDNLIKGIIECHIDRPHLAPMLILPRREVRPCQLQHPGQQQTYEQHTDNSPEIPFALLHLPPPFSAPITNDYIIDKRNLAIKTPGSFWGMNYIMECRMYIMQTGQRHSR